MKRKLTSLLTLFVFCLSLVPMQLLAAEPTADETVRLIVELDTPCLSEHSASDITAAQNGTQAYMESNAASAALKEVEASQAAVLSEIAALDGGVRAASNGSGEAASSKTITPVFSYTHVLNGFVIEVPASQVDAIRTLPGVKAAEVDQKIAISEPVSDEPTDDAAAYTNALLTDTGADVLHNQGISGEGQVVAVIDSELQIDHEFFAGEVEQPAIAKGDVAFQLKNGSLNIASDTDIDDIYYSSKIPFAFNYARPSTDTGYKDNGVIHGTHVSGIAVGRNGTLLNGERFSGVAPEAQLIFLGVGDDNGYLSDSALIAAYDDVLKLDVDAVNFSAGTDYGAKTTIMQDAYNNLACTDIYFSAAAGNSSRGFDGQAVAATDTDSYTVNYPSTLLDATSVASSTLSSVLIKINQLSIEGSDTTLPYIIPNALYFNDAFKDAYYETVYCGIGRTEDFAGKDLEGKIAVVDRGVISTATQSNNALAAGAIGIIFISENDTLSTSVFYVNDILPAITVTKAAREILSKDGVRVKADDQEATIVTETNALQMSSFSSWGPDATLLLKPDITAPGSDIYSSWPSDDGTTNAYTQASGTSMATPAITGCATLLRQYLKENAADYPAFDSTQGYKQLIENLMMSTATIFTQEDDVEASPRQQGAGLVNLEAAASTPVILVGDDKKTKISLGDEIGTTFTLEATAKNLTDKDVTYDAITVSVVTDAVNGEGAVSLMRALQTTSIKLPKSVTVPAGGSAPIQATITLDKVDVNENLDTFTNGFFVEGYLTLSSDEAPSIHLPYMGYYGDWSSMEGFDAPFFSGESKLGETALYSTTDLDSTQNYKLGTDTLFSALAGTSNEDPSGREDWAAISPNNDGYFDTLSVGILPLREMKDVSATISDSQGDIVLQADYESSDGPLVFKGNLQLLKFDEQTINDLPDGDYSVKLTGKVNAEGSKSEALSFHFTIDRELPSLDKWEITKEDDKTMLNLSISDNEAVSGIFISGQLADGSYYTKTANTIEQDDASSLDASFSIGGYDPDTLTAVIFDYAGNGFVCFGLDATTFRDTPKDAWYYDAVAAVADKGLMYGVDQDGNFAPNAATTRGQLVTILYRLAGASEVSTTASFSDVAEDAYYSKAVAWAAENDIVAGFSDGTFRPGDSLTREQLAAMLRNYAASTGQDVDVNYDLSSYTDVDKDSWSYESLGWANKQGLLTGITPTTLSPKTIATRAQLATILTRYLDVIDGE